MLYVCLFAAAWWAVAYLAVHVFTDMARQAHRWDDDDGPTS